MKGDTEDKVRLALKQTPGLVIYKPPDDARNWKPCDFMVWWDIGPDGSERGYQYTGSAWIEVKDNPQVASFPLADIRPSQRQGIAAAGDVGMRYWLVIWWRELKVWTVSDARQLLSDVAAEEEASTQRATSVSYTALVSRFGIEARPDNLGSILAMALRGEL